MTKRRLLLGLILLALGAAVLAPVLYLRSASHGAKVVRISTSKNAWCMLTLIAIDIGLFPKHGLVPDVSYNAAGRINMDALLSGSADVGNIVEMNIANAAKAGERDLLILGSIARSTDYAFVTHVPNLRRSLERDNSDFAFLRGKRIGFAPGTGAEPFLFAVLQKHGLREEEVKLVPIPPNGLVDQFIAGSVDVAVSWQPFVHSMAERASGAVTIDRDPSAFRGIMTVAVLRKWANDNPDLVKRLTLVYQDASRFVEQNPERAQAIVARRGSLPPDLVREMWGRYDPAFRAPNSDDEASVQAAIDVISHSRKPSGAEVNFRRYFVR